MIQLATPPADAELLGARTPPHSIECEQSVLGGLLLNNAAYDRVADLLHESDFYRADHRLIYRHLLQMIEHNRPADALTLAERLGPEALREVGGQSYIGALALNTPSAANIRRYAEIVREKALLRGVIAMGTEFADKGYAVGADAHALVDAAESQLFTMREKHTRTEIVTMQTAMSEAVEHIDKMYNLEGTKLAGIATGLHELDQLTGGLEGGDLVIVGGRPSMGKTSLALGWSQYVAETSGKGVAFFSMEMSRKQLALRLLASASGIAMHALRTGNVAEDDWAHIVDHTGKLSDLKLHIDDTAGITVSFMRSRLRRLVREQGPLGLIVVDYLTLMSGEGNNANDRVEAIAKGLKEVAKEFATPVVALAQLNRAVELRPNKRPIMADLRDSGAIEQAADIVLFVYRDEVYNPDTQFRGIAELLIAKQRNGPVGTAHVDFKAKRMRFVNRTDPLPVSNEPEIRGTRSRKVVDFKTQASGEDK